MKKELTSDLTSYDFLKFTALILMIVDHLGYYFFPEEAWMRVVGRMSAPIWLFLIGYAKSRDFSPRMWIAIGIMTFSAVAVGEALLPVTILATMLVFRFLIDPVMAGVRRAPSMLYPLCALLFCLMIPTFNLLEYGALAMIFVIFGYAVRHQDEDPYLKSQLVTLAMVSAFTHGAFQAYFFFAGMFDMVQKTTLIAGLLALMFLLMKFRPQSFPTLTAKTPAPLVWLIQMGGRRSLELYVAHVVLFRVVALSMGNSTLKLFDFHIF